MFKNELVRWQVFEYAPSFKRWMPDAEYELAANVGYNIPYEVTFWGNLNMVN